MMRKIQLQFQFGIQIVRHATSHTKLLSAIMSIYENSIEKFDAGDVQKVVINFMDSVPTGVLKEVSHIDGILLVSAHLDYNSYFHSPKPANELFLETIHEATLEVAKNQSWDTKVFEDAYSIIKAKNFVFFGHLQKISHNRKRNHTARLYWEMTDRLRVFIEIDEDANQRHLVSVVGAGIDLLRLLFGPLKWVDEFNVILNLKTRCDYWNLNIQTGQLDFFFARAVANDPHGLYDLAVMYFEGDTVLQNEELGMFYLKKAADAKFGRAIKKLRSLD
ncbi:MAG: hypothetical protein EOP04_30105 [Proteobacteria bacterium]|nr:MAG: hypothetical protein EOP04_30105 [Pseudomonadota bacterium]